MKGPQLEDGYTRIAHEILDEICKFKLNGSQLRIILKIWRLTYGFNRKDHSISVTLLEEATGLSERTVKKELAYLIRNNVLIVTKESTSISPRKIAFNKNYDEWIIQRSGEPMEDQLKHFIAGVNNTSPLGVNNTSPQSNENPYLGVNDTSPKIDKRSLKIINKDNSDWFDEFWSVYPRRVSKQAAKKAWLRLSKEAEFDPTLIIENTINFAETCKLLETETKFIPHPSTYLNQKRYEDYSVVDPEGISKGKKKLSDNLEFLREQMEGGYEQTRGQLTSGEGFGCLPE